MGAAIEAYDAFVSDADGTFNIHGRFLTIDVYLNFPANSGGNIDAVKLVSDDVDDYATRIMRVVHRGPPPNIAQTVKTNNAIGAPDSNATGLGSCFAGTGSEYVSLMSITLAFPKSFFTYDQFLNDPVTSDAPLVFGSGPGGGSLFSFNPTTSGNLSFTPVTVHPSAFEFSDVPPPAGRRSARLLTRATTPSRLRRQVSRLLSWASPSRTWPG